MRQNVINALMDSISRTPAFSISTRHFKIHSGVLKEERSIQSEGYILVAKEKYLLAEVVRKKISSKEIPFEGELILEYHINASSEIVEGYLTLVIF